MAGPVTPPSAAALAAEVAASPVFSRSKRHGALLQFLASQPAEELKESLIGHRFFERAADYDPKADPVVRVEVRRLRERLAEHYAGTGLGASWRLEIPKGGYQVTVVAAEVPVSAPAPTAQRKWWGVAAVVVLCAVAVAWIARVNLAAPVQSIALLDLETRGAVPEGMAPGLTMELATALTAIDGLIVVGPSASARAAAGRPLPDPREIARNLRVDAVLSGTLEAMGSRVRLQMRMTRGEDGAILWAQSEDHDLVDTFTLQSELAARLAAAVHLKLLHKPAAQRPVANEALMDYRRGKEQIERRTAPAIVKGIGLLQASVQKEPEFAAAWGALAEACAMAPDYMVDRGDWAQQARAAAARTLQIDANNADAYSALGWVQFSTDLAVGPARKSFLKALRLNPSHLTAHRRIGLLYMTIERFPEAEQALKAALRLDPLAPIAHINLAELYQARGDLAAEERELRSVLDANPTYMLARVMLAVNYGQAKRCEEARALARKIEEDAEAKEWRAPMVFVMGACGDLEPARKMAAEEPGSADHLAPLLGDWPRARRHYAEIVEKNPLRAANYSINPVWMSDPEVRRMWQGLLQKMRASDK